MHYSKQVYRPPYEANSLLLQVTVGCAHNKCTFCTMYRDVQFSMEELAQVEADIKEAKGMYSHVTRVFLVNGDAFVLPAERLKKIAKLIHEHLPYVETITMYASINNIKAKSDEELKELRALGINDLWIGVETGHEETLKYFNKGFTVKDSYEQLARLNKAGIDHIDFYIFGAAGKGKSQENVVATTKLINATKPVGVCVKTMGAFEKSQLAKDVAAGTFVFADEREVLDEQKTFIEMIDVTASYLGRHALNTVTFDADLPKDKEKALSFIDDAHTKMGQEFLDSVPERLSI